MSDQSAYLPAAAAGSGPAHDRISSRTWYAYIAIRSRDCRMSTCPADLFRRFQTLCPSLNQWPGRRLGEEKAAHSGTFVLTIEPSRAALEWNAAAGVWK